MEVRPVQNDPKHDELYSAFYNSLEDYLSTATTRVSESKALFNLGVYDELFKLIEKARKDPLSLLSEKIEFEVKGFHQLLEGMVNSFLKKHDDLIKRYARIDHNNNALYYYIVLKDDSAVNKRPFLKFLYDYENKPISHKFPMIFDFVSEQVFNELVKDYDDLINGEISRTGKA